MQISLTPSSPAGQREALMRYTDRVGLVDTYWENQILSAAVFSLRADGEEIGFCSYLEKERALTSFYISDPLFPCSQRVFSQTLSIFRPSLAYLVSGDEPFLSLCLDVGARLAAHGYFFRDSEHLTAPPEFPAERILPAGERDLKDLLATHFYGDLQDPENPLFVLRDETGAFLGTGHIATWMQKLGKSWGAVGMYTAPEHRGKGVGRSIILALKARTLEMGLSPIAGCYVTNEASRRTLESCGFVMGARYIKAFF